ncbi:MAG: hypothetical protein MUE30_14770 [Spirosomaceae bacterium]|nr:hypothetical protein [Spirosomataceae bacterium]
MSAKNRRQQLPMPSDIQDYLFSSETASILEKAQGHLTIGDDRNIRHLSGKYERYYLDEPRKLIHKELLNIHTDGRVIVRAHGGIQKGMAVYFVNATLAINLMSLNEDELFCSQLLGYVGRFAYNDIECITVLCTTIDENNIPVARRELLVPADTFGALPEKIQIESQAFFKLNYKYPHLAKVLQTRPLHATARVTWQ